MDARERFVAALAEAVGTVYYAAGEIYFSIAQISAIADDQHVPEAERRATLDLLDERGLLLRQPGGWSYSDGIGLLLHHEETDRRLAWQRNALRRDILGRAAAAYEAGSSWLVYDEGDDEFVDAPWAAAFTASRALRHLGLLHVDAYMGHHFRAQITPSGHELHRDERQLRRALPVNAVEDESAGAAVVPDVLRELILDVADLLETRSWTGAARELADGDAQYREGHWTDAVREYYSALESALKHRLDDDGVAYAAGATLKDLARLAAAADVIPTNYQALFGFADSIRSPRSHGTGAKPVEVEVGKAEALLMGNHVRGLVLYLGQRP